MNQNFSRKSNLSLYGGFMKSKKTEDKSNNFHVIFDKWRIFQ
jgi:hypothetical protein